MLFFPPLGVDPDILSDGLSMCHECTHNCLFLNSRLLQRWTSSSVGLESQVFHTIANKTSNRGYRSMHGVSVSSNVTTANDKTRRIAGLLFGQVVTWRRAVKIWNSLRVLKLDLYGKILKIILPHPKKSQLFASVGC